MPNIIYNVEILTFKTLIIIEQKNMKTFKKTLTMAFLATGLIAGFSACSSDDDNETNTTYGKINFNYTFSDDMLNVCDIKISYLDSDGKTRKTETITSNSFSKEIRYKSIPLTAKDTLFMDLKSSYTQKDNYNIKFTSHLEADRVENGEIIRGDVPSDRKIDTLVTKEKLKTLFPSKLIHTLVVK